ncbi:MAG TPA: hypothetical protein VFS55_00790 [Dokdonella sp.]|nr:hypothetical protein [Dokdonella sp.]
MAIDQHAGADARRRIERDAKVRVNRDVAWEVMVEPFDADAALEERDERRTILGDRDVERRDGVACARVDALQQRDVALHAADEDALLRVGKAQLVERADAVGIAVEGIEMRHERGAGASRGAVNEREAGDAVPEARS